MRMDKQTLAWINNDKEWIKKLRPYNRRRRGTGMNALLPSSDKPNLWNYRVGGYELRFLFDTSGWGRKKWMHTPQLGNNDCICPKCSGRGEKWGYYPISMMNRIYDLYREGKISEDDINDPIVKEMIVDE